MKLFEVNVNVTTEKFGERTFYVITSCSWKSFDYSL